MAKIKAEQYAAAIPECCRYTTYDDHLNMGLCWGLMSSIDTGKEHVCGWCELNNEHTPEEWNAWWIELQSKQKVWNILNAETR